MKLRGDQNPEGSQQLFAIHECYQAEQHDRDSHRLANARHSQLHHQDRKTQCQKEHRLGRLFGKPCKAIYKDHRARHVHPDKIKTQLMKAQIQPMKEAFFLVKKV